MAFLRCLWYSCGGFRTYRNLLNLPLRSVLGFWITLSALIAVVFTATALYWLETGFPLIEKFARRLPSFSLTNGAAYSALPQPYLTNTNQFPIILDLERNTNDFSKKYPSGLLLGKKDFQFWSEGSRPVAFLWAGWPDGKVDAAYLDHLRRETIHMVPWFWAVIWLILVAGGMLQALFFTMLAGLLEQTLLPRFTFSQLFNISLFAITPPAIIVTTYLILGLHEIRMDLLYFCVYCLFLVMASGACRTLLRKPDKEKRDEE